MLIKAIDSFCPLVRRDLSVLRVKKSVNCSKRGLDPQVIQWLAERKEGSCHCLATPQHLH